MRPSKTLLLLALASVFLALALAGGPAPAARAQGGYRLILYPADTSGFPTISFKFDLYDPQGNYIGNLLRQSVTLLENGEPVPFDRFESQPQGMQVIVAVNTGPALAVRDGFGVSRYDKVAGALLAWAEALPAENSDQLGLVTTVGVIHSQGTPETWRQAFLTFTPENRSATPSLQSLSVALASLEQTAPPPGQKHAILFISPHIDGAPQAAFDDLTNRALSSQTRVFVWYVDSDAYANHSSAQGLKLLAQRTGGSFVQFTGVETLPDPESYFSALRSVYALTYTSRINRPGDQVLTLQVTSPLDGQQISAEMTFPLNVQPPNPILLSPPFQLVRQLPEGVYELDALTPTQTEITILIEFPDGFPRNLTRTTLYVDGQIMDENTAPPFDTFTWDLSAYTTTAEHSLSVEAVDVLSMSRVSLSLPVVVTVVQPPSGWRVFLARYQSELTLGASIAAGVVVVLIILMGVRLRLPSLSAARRADPVTQPVKASIEPRGKKTTQSPLDWVRRMRQSPPPAVLERVDANGHPLTGAPIPLTASEITFGADPTQSLYILDDPSVAGLQARLLHDDKGNFTLYDQNSISGTWVNLEPVPPSGRILRHGDMINFGRLSYRFMLRKTPPTPAPRIEQGK